MGTVQRDRDRKESMTKGLRKRDEDINEKLFDGVRNRERVRICEKEIARKREILIEKVRERYCDRESERKRVTE